MKLFKAAGNTEHAEKGKMLKISIKCDSEEWAGADKRDEQLKTGAALALVEVDKMRVCWTEKVEIIRHLSAAFIRLKHTCFCCCSFH